MFTRVPGKKRKSRGKSSSSHEERKSANERSIGLIPDPNKKEATRTKRAKLSAFKASDPGKKDSFVLKACQNSINSHSSDDLNKKEATCRNRPKHSALRGAGKKDSFNLKACQKSIDNHSSSNLKKNETTCTKRAKRCALRGKKDSFVLKACQKSINNHSSGNLNKKEATRTMRPSLCVCPLPWRAHSSFHGSYRGVGNRKALSGFAKKLEEVKLRKKRLKADARRMASILRKEVKRRSTAEGYCHCKRTQALRNVTLRVNEMAEKRRLAFHRNFCLPARAQHAKKYHAIFCVSLKKLWVNMSLPDCDCKQGKARKKMKLENIASGKVCGPQSNVFSCRSYFYL